MVRGMRRVGIDLLQEATREMVIAAAAGETVIVTDDRGWPIVQLTKLDEEVDSDVEPPKDRYEELIAAGLIRRGTGDFDSLPDPEPAPPRPPERDHRNKTGKRWEMVAKMRELEEFMRSEGYVNDARELDRISDYLADDAAAEDAKKRDESTDKGTAEAAVYASSST